MGDHFNDPVVGFIVIQLLKKKVTCRFVTLNSEIFVSVKCMFVRYHVHNYNYCYQFLYLNSINTVISISAGIYSHKYNDIITGTLTNGLVRSL